MDNPVDDLELLVGRYWDHHRLAGSSIRAERLRAQESTSPEYVAWAQIDRAVLDATPGIGTVLRHLADTAANDRAIAYLGAGHLEDLLHEQPDLFAAEVLPLADQSANLRAACRSIDPDDTVSEKLVADLLAATTDSAHET